MRGAVIFMLHRIAAEPGSRLRQNRSLAVTPDWLSGFIDRAQASGMRFVSIDELYERIQNNRSLEGLALLTADDGYRDILLEGLPVLEAHRVPLCLYVSTAFPDRTMKLWWHVLEDALLDRCGEDPALLREGQLGLQEREFSRLHKCYMRSHANAPDSFFEEHFPGFSFSWHDYAERYGLSWEELIRLSRSPLLTIGSHGDTHRRMSKQEEGALADEFTRSKRLLQEKSGQNVLHFSYPHGGLNDANRREYAMAATHGFHTGVTTCHGLVTSRHRNSLMSLPRVDLVEGVELEQIDSFKRLLKARVKRLVTPLLA